MELFRPLRKLIKFLYQIQLEKLITKIEITVHRS
jgi:hypothetical protein